MGQQLTAEVPLPVEPASATASQPATPSADNIRRWSRWTTLVVERLPLPYYLVVFLASLIIAAEQAFEYTLEAGTSQNVPVEKLSKYIVLPILTVYMLVMLKMLKGTAVQSLAELRPSVQIDDKEYDAYVHRMVNTNRRVEFALLLVSVAGVFFLFVLLDIPLAVTALAHTRQFGLASVFILSPYVIFGWAFLTLVFSALQLGSALGKLAHRPLSVNIYDPNNLLPFGHMALIYSLSVAGVILILLIGLGQPTQPSSWAVIVSLSVASLVALVIPLWGVNRQMREARHAELGRIYEQLRNVHDTILNHTHLDPTDLRQMSDRTTTLVNLRKVVLETPTWPYRDTLMIIRAVAIAIAPLLYFVLTQIIANFLSANSIKH